jgi:hypothetical protein
MASVGVRDSPGSRPLEVCLAYLGVGVDKFIHFGF